MEMMARLPCDTPIGVRNVLQRCLEKDVRLRLRDIGEVPGAIGCCVACHAGVWPLISKVAPAPQRKSRQVPPWAWAAAVAAAVAFAVTGWWRAPPPVAASPLLRFSVEVGPGAVANAGLGPDAVLSPDGTRLVFCSRGADGQHRLSTRLLDQEQTTELAGTENAHDPFFSPDGQWLAFLADGKLKKVSLRGGPPLMLCEAVDSRGGSWGPDGNIVLAPTTRGGLVRLPAEGGTPQLITRLDLSRREKTHRWPQVLPGGQNCSVYRPQHPRQL